MLALFVKDKKNMIKLVISDVDGTLIGKDFCLPADAPNFVKKLNDNNILFTLATGRPEEFISPFIDSMKIDIPYVCSNGATLMNGAKAVMRKQFPLKSVKNVLEKATELGMEIWYTNTGVDYALDYTAQKIVQVEHKDTGTWVDFDIDTVHVEKILIMDFVRDGRISHIEDICKDLQGVCKYVRYRDKAVEIMEKTVTKATGIKALLELLNIDVSEVLVVGDDDNDKEMFSLGATSAAVSNASPNVLGLVDFVCTKPQFEGVKEAVYHFCPNTE